MPSPRLTLLTAASLICAATPAFAAPQGPLRAPATSSPAAAKLSVVRAGKPMRGAQSLTGGNGLGIGMLVVVLGFAAWAAYEMIDGDDPASP